MYLLHTCRNIIEKKRIRIIGKFSSQELQNRMFGEILCKLPPPAYSMPSFWPLSFPVSKSWAGIIRIGRCDFCTTGDIMWVKVVDKLADAHNRCARYVVSGLRRACETALYFYFRSSKAESSEATFCTMAASVKTVLVIAATAVLLSCCIQVSVSQTGWVCTLT